jgi:phospholipid/cholesterol/gamma-HCH transport system permease protein
LTEAVGYGDMIGGIFKATVFGLLVAAIGCLRGLQTQSGASAVGVSTTRAVVSAIILIAVADAIFSILFYVLDI